MVNMAGFSGCPKKQVHRNRDPGSYPLNAKVSEASSLFLCFTGINYPQTVPVTVLGPTACSRQYAAPGSMGISILPGMVCTTVVGEPPHCEVSFQFPILMQQTLDILSPCSS